VVFDDLFAPSETPPSPKVRLGQPSVVVVDPRQQIANELLVKITGLNNKVDAFLSDYIKPVNDSIQALTQQQIDIQVAYNASIEKLREEKEAKKYELWTLQDELNKLKEELKNLNSEHSKLLAELEAERLLDEVTGKLLEILAEASFTDKLMDFQLNDVKFMSVAYLKDKPGVLNANDMGLGKTFESVAIDYILCKLFVQKHGRQPRVLWLTKKSLIEQTCQEIAKWNPERNIIPILGTWPKAQRELAIGFCLQGSANGGPPPMLITNYEVMNSTDKLMDLDWDVIIIDEVGKLKGGAQAKPTQVWLNARDLCKKAEFKIFMSGTPIQNKPSDMWAYLHLFDPGKFPTLAKFEYEYCYYGGGPINYEQLIKTMGDVTIRHSKKDVLLDLPDKVKDYYYPDMEFEQRALYNEMRDNMFMFLDDEKDAFVDASCLLAYYTRLRQIAVLPKSVKMLVGAAKETRMLDCDESGNITEAMGIIEDCLAANEPVVVFSNFLDPLFETAKRVSEITLPNGEKARARCITGDTVAKNIHNSYIQELNNDEIQVLCVSVKAGGEGLNLQKASHAIFLDEWWNPAVNFQAEDRLHRKGQKNAVTIHVMRALESIQDGMIKAKLEAKEEMIEGIMEAKGLRKGAEWKALLADLV
jgi:SNF2 family DNA or RNA helicase